jgi:hypothetical protein
MSKKRQTQILQQKTTFEDLREEQKIYSQYEKDLPQEFNEFVARIPNLEGFLDKAYQILAKTRPDWAAEDVKKILKFVAVGRLRYSPATFSDDLPDLLKDKIKAEYGRRGAYVTNLAKENRKKHQSMSSKGGKAGSSEDKAFAGAKSSKSREVRKAIELYETRPSIGNPTFTADVDNSPLGQIVELRMEANKQTRAQFDIAFGKAVEQSRKTKQTAYIVFSGTAGGEVNKIASRIA